MTITEQKAFLQTYTGKAQAPAHPAQDWADAVKELHFEAQTAPVEFANAYGVYERLTITYEGRTVTARVIRPASAGQHPLLLMYHDLNRGVRRLASHDAVFGAGLWYGGAGGRALQGRLAG